MLQKFIYKIEREARRLNRAPRARSNLRAKRDENMPARRADFFSFFHASEFFLMQNYT